MRLPFVLITVLFVTAIGCGQNDLVPASGRIVFLGAPEAKANVSFFRVDGNGPAAIAVTGDDGRFELRTLGRSGAVPGKYKIVVQKDTSADFQIPENRIAGEYMRERGALPRQVLPFIYSDVNTTPLTREIGSDESKNDFHINLEGQRPK